VWIKVDIGNGASCHVGYKSCFYRSVPLGKIKDSSKIEIEFKEKEKKFDPKKVYKNDSNPTKL
jgi:phosphoribosyl-AMP cyclohydrolase